MIFEEKHWIELISSCCEKGRDGGYFSESYSEKRRYAKVKTLTYLLNCMVRAVALANSLCWL